MRYVLINSSLSHWKGYQVPNSEINEDLPTQTMCMESIQRKLVVLNCSLSSLFLRASQWIKS